jgi:hypothetical protein
MNFLYSGLTVLTHIQWKANCLVYYKQTAASCWVSRTIQIDPVRLCSCWPDWLLVLWLHGASADTRNLNCSLFIKIDFLMHWGRLYFHHCLSNRLCISLVGLHLSIRREVWGTSRLTGKKVKVKVILRPTVSRPVCLGVRHPSGTRDQFFPFSLELFLGGSGFVYVGRPLWREVGYAVFSFCWASPVQHFSGLSPMGLSTLTPGASRFFEK